ncbi:MAG: hypothetical protein ACLTKE_09815 [Coprococcus sp.]
MGKKEFHQRQHKRLYVQLPKLYVMCITVNGNHEQRMKENTEKYERHLFTISRRIKKQCVHFLENEHIRLTWDGQFRLIYMVWRFRIKFYTKFAKHGIVCRRNSKLYGGASEKNIIRL